MKKQKTFSWIFSHLFKTSYSAMIMAETDTCRSPCQKLSPVKRANNERIIDKPN